jgi:DNA-binding Lrp family transcriptional regulator
MKKTEIVYRELIEFWKARLTQLELSRRLGFSLSTVNNALRPLVRMGAVAVLPRRLKVIDREKVILYWASIRNLEKDIIYSARTAANPSEIEKGMPADVIYTAYSGFKFRFGSIPADYSEVWVYSQSLDEIKKRFPSLKGPPNLFVLKPDDRLVKLAKDNIAPKSQLFVDLWNIKEWYAKEFIKALREKI